MTIPVWIPRKYDSRFSLLGAMADELAIAFDAKGYEVIDGMPDGSRVGIYIFFNDPARGPQNELTNCRNSDPC